MWCDTYVFGCHVKLKNILNNCKLKKKKKKGFGVVATRGGRPPPFGLQVASGLVWGWLNHPQGPKEIFF
jgi:hypothetical protein